MPGTSDAPAKPHDAIASPGDGVPGPYAVGEHATALRSKLRACARVLLVGELVNLRPSRARVYFELRDAGGAMPCAAWREDWERIWGRGRGAAAQGTKVGGG